MRSVCYSAVIQRKASEFLQLACRCGQSGNPHLCSDHSPPAGCRFMRPSKQLTMPPGPGNTTNTAESSKTDVTVIMITLTNCITWSPQKYRPNRAVHNHLSLDLWPIYSMPATEVQEVVKNSNLVKDCKSQFWKVSSWDQDMLHNWKTAETCHQQN